MFVVPLSGDNFKTKDGFTYSVVAFTNYKNDGPAVIATPEDNTLQQTIYFDDIVELNGTEVKYVTTGHASKVFEAAATFERKYQLPQPNDIVYADTPDGVEKTFKVVKLKLHVQDKYSSGLLIDVEDVDTEDRSTIVLNQINDIESTIFSKQKFLKYYEEYMSKAEEHELT